MEKGSSSSSSSSCSSSSSTFASGGPDSSLINGLKFGKKIYYEGVGPKPSPAKRGRSGPVHTARCQVEGCKVDLSGVKAYYSRHKVCGMHSKSPKVIVAGLEQRFCQQCSRFHQLPEFDQGKRSCRRRLAGHNERRRKPPQGSLLSPSFATLCPSTFDNNESSKTGGFVMDFSCAYPTNPTSERGLTNNYNEASITGKFQLPLLSISSPPSPLSDLLTSRPGYSHRPAVVEDDGSFNINALSLLSSLPWAGPKGRLGVVNNFLGHPSHDPPPVGQFVCSPPDLGLGQAMNGRSDNGGPESGQRSEISLQFHETRGYDSSSTVQHNMHWSL